MKQTAQRQVFLFSALAHTLVLSVLVEMDNRGPLPVREPRTEKAPEPVVARLVRPPLSVLRDMRTPPPRPTPPPPERTASDRFSAGMPSPGRPKILELHRDKSLLDSVDKGDSLKAVPSPTPNQAAQAAAVPTPQPSFDALSAPGGDPQMTVPRPERRSEPERAGSRGPLLAAVERQVGTLGKQGLPSGTGRQIGPLFFDPEGADFTLWSDHLRAELDRNWLAPTSAYLGFGTTTVAEFTVERDGRISQLRLLKSCGVTALDRAAMNALIGARFHPLPPDFKPDRAVFRVEFLYNEERG